MKLHTRISLIALTGLLTLTGGCATSTPQQDSADSSETRDDHDPFIRANRAILNFNLKVDRYALKPTAKVYAKLPQPVRTGIGNFFSNLGIPYTILNDLLQGKLGHAGRDTGRFLINTTVGIAGLFDVATGIGLPKHSEDLGQTLAVWGVPAGPYLVLPILGPASLRDATGKVRRLIYDSPYTEPLSSLDSLERYSATALQVVDVRANLIGIDDLLELQPDLYLFLREGYRQQRNQSIYDGNPPDGQDGPSEDQLLDELLDDEE